MRVKIRNQATAVELLELACNCKILLADGGFVFQRQMGNPRRASMIYTTGTPRRTARAATLEALREFGRELRAILALKPRIRVERSSISLSQSYVAVYFDDHLVERFSNCPPLPSGNPLDRGPWKSELHPLDAWETIGAGYVLRHARRLLTGPDECLIDPLAEALSSMSKPKQA